jgi:hypothetical protein
MTRRSWTRAATLATVLAAAEPQAAPASAADDANMARYRRASACVAVMKQDVLTLASRFRAGDTAVRPEMQRLTELGFTFIGTAYKSGLRKQLADPMLADAEKAQKRQSPEALRQLSADCQTEGDQLWRDSNFIERALVSNRARARVEALLAPDKGR